VTIRVLYHREPGGWWAESPELDGWTVAGEEVGQLVDDGVTFALAGAAVDRGERFDEARLADVSAPPDVRPERGFGGAESHDGTEPVRDYDDQGKARHHPEPATEVALPEPSLAGDADGDDEQRPGNREECAVDGCSER
jgi:hypothetical protein